MSDNQTLTENNYKQILSEIKDSFKKDHFLFYCYYSVINTVQINKDLPASAAIDFTKKDEKITLKLELNPTYKTDLTISDWKFIITHELVHLLLEHPKRYFINKAIHDEIDNFRNLFNIACDISVNHLCVDMFNINRNELTYWKDYCWVETIFHTRPGFEHIKEGETTEYYLDLLINIGEDNLPVVDNHSEWLLGDYSEYSTTNDYFNKINETYVGELAKQLNKSISHVKKLIEEIKQQSDINDGNSQGGIFGYGSSSLKSNMKRATEQLTGLEKMPKMRQAWAELFKTVKKKVGFDEEMAESWSRPNRRFMSIINNSDVLLPTEYDAESKGKMQLSIFVNTGKYCSRYINSFKRLIASIPKDTISYKLYSFSNKVYEAKDINDLYFTGGGAYISSVEKFINSSGYHYPDAILVITDPTFYDSVQPKHPERWFFCLTNDKCYYSNKFKIFKGATLCKVDDIIQNKCIISKT